MLQPCLPSLAFLAISLSLPHGQTWPSQGLLHFFSAPNSNLVHD